ncbi:MAG: hypothetical protein KGO96_04010 [Elusimicrobia bacterium]|nr:hypothetical protein [Elusimicrobiota bacterium]MDE2236451.1 hypothetical protein [Elusimicrobiota bacterium]MDE2425058.1 hypothetical protein [Elusimicrobiota bacterium]
MICALLLDPNDAPDFPDNSGQALGRPLAAYPFIAARATGLIGRYYAVTASAAIKTVALQNSAVLIDPPKERAEPRELLRAGFLYIQDDLRSEDPLELLLVFFSNAPLVTNALLRSGIEALQARPELDGALSVSPSARRHPLFAKREQDGLLEPLAAAGGPAAARELWYPDWSVQILRPRLLRPPYSGAPPFPWLGGKVLPLKQWGGGPIDYRWQIPSAEYWLLKQGYPDLNAELQPQPKPQPLHKSERR